MFYAVVGKSFDAKNNKQILTSIKNKYKELEPNLTMDELCGNTFQPTAITITKYMAGMTLLERLRKLVKQRKSGLLTGELL